MHHRASKDPSNSRGRGRAPAVPGMKKLPASLPPDLKDLLGSLDRGLRSLYGEERYGGLVLYGSYARGEAHEGSDVDLLLLLKGEVNTTREIVRSGDVEWPLALESGYLLALLPVSVEEYETSEASYLWNARREGIGVG